MISFIIIGMSRLSCQIIVQEVSNKKVAFHFWEADFFDNFNTFIQTIGKTK